jgi:curved DNA-binding protein CbpA
MPQITEAEVFRACRTLFGPELKLNRDFLRYLQPSGVRTAYRKMAKSTHPDRFAISSSDSVEEQQRQFQDLNQAHETIQKFLKQRERTPANMPFQSHTRTAYNYQKRRRKEHSHSKYYRGPLPSRPLQFGLFLYYLGLIPFSAVISAITWQRKQRPAIGAIAKRWGWLDSDQVVQILNHRSSPHKFGERAQQLGMLTSLQVRAILLHQRTRQKMLGKHFVEQGYFDEPTLNQLLSQLAEHNRTYRQGYSGNYYFYHH